MDLGWKRLIPGALAMLMIVAGFQIDREWGLISFGASILLFAVLLRAIDMGEAATEVEAAQNDLRTRGVGQ
jgi:hypothetical protein